MQIEISQLKFEEPDNPEKLEQIKTLAESMAEVGLSQPVVIRQTTNEVISGVNRVRAAKSLGWTHIEADIRDLDEKRGKELRLHENLKRENLPWWEQVVLVEQLHSLRQEEHGIAQKGRPSKEDSFVKQGWSIRDTAEELGVGVGPLSEDLSLARALRHDASLAKVKDKKTAIKLVRIAAARHLNEQEAGLPVKFAYNEVFFGDSASVLAQLPPNSIDHCITDPPWIRFFDPALTLDERTVPVFRELYRVLKSGAFVYIFCGLDDYAYYAGWDAPDANNPSEKVHNRGVLENLGYQVSTTPIVWEKENSLSRRGVRAWEYDRDFEFIIVAAKGSPTLVTSRRLSGVKHFAIVPPVKMIHSNEKPIALLKDIITDCSYENQIIVDPFGGSGALASACIETDRHYIVIERDKKYYDGIVERLRKKE